MIVLYNHKTKCDSQVKTEKTKLGGDKTLLPLWRQLAGRLPPCFKHGEVYLHPQGPGVDTSLLLDTRRSFPVQPVLPVCLSILHLKHLFLPTRPLPAYSIHPVWSSVVFVYHSHGCWHVMCALQWNRSTVPLSFSSRCCCGACGYRFLLLLYHVWQFCMKNVLKRRWKWSTIRWND